MMVLYLLQVLGRSVLMNLRNRAIHFALFTTVSELILRFLQPTNNWCYHDNNKVATRTKCIFRHSPTKSNCMQHFFLGGEGGRGSKFFISHFVWLLQRINSKWMRLSILWRIMEIEEGVIHPSYDTKAEFNNCFIIHSK